MDKNIFTLWLQGWNNAKWVNKQVAESWEIIRNGKFKELWLRVP